MQLLRWRETGFCLVFAAACAGCQAGTTVDGGPSPASPAPTPTATRTAGVPIGMPTLGSGSPGPTPSGPTPIPTPTRSPLPPGVTPSPTPSPTPTPTPVATIFMTTLPSGPKIYVANHGKEGASPSVTIYAQAASGNATPLATLAGTNANLAQIQFPGVDTAGNLYLSNAGTASNATSGYVSFYGATGQSGDQPASSSVGGLPNPEGIAFDSKGDVYVAAAREIVVYPPATGAWSAPLRTLTGELAEGTEPYGIAIDGSDRLYVALGDQVEVYAAGASGNDSPIQEFDESNDMAAGLDSCLGIAVDTSANIYCANFNNSTITEYAAGSTGTSVTPMVTATSTTAQTIDEPFGIFIDASNTIYVANYGNSSVSVFTSTGLATGTATRTISGGATGLDFPYGIYVR